MTLKANLDSVVLTILHHRDMHNQHPIQLPPLRLLALSLGTKTILPPFLVRCYGTKTILAPFLALSLGTKTTLPFPLRMAEW
jgi:hypothetical protein